MAMPLRARFERSVDRSGEHHVWTGSVRPGNGWGRFKRDGRERTAHEVAWELEHGPLEPGQRVCACEDVPACVRVDHLRLDDRTSDTDVPVARVASGRSRRGGGTVRELGGGTWELAVSVGDFDDGGRRRRYRRVRARNRSEAARHLAGFVADVNERGATRRRADRDLTFDDAVERFLTEHLAGELGREDQTVRDYRNVHRKWFAPYYGRRRLADVDRAVIDAGFGRMVHAGLSRSRMNQARSLYAPLFRWARDRQLVLRNPMAEFRLPKSKQVARQRTAPEAEHIALLLSTAIDVVPEIATLLTLGAVTGMRRGELVALRRSRIRWNVREIRVDASVDGRRLKGTKTNVERTFSLDDATIAMLRRHCKEMDERADVCGTTIGDDAFIFSLEPDARSPMSPDFVTKRVAVLKNALGIADKRPATIELEDEALRLWEAPPPRRRGGRTGPVPAGSLSYREIGMVLCRSERWAALAVASATRRREVKQRDVDLAFDGSIIALRKFTSTELLDSGFNLSMVAQRQGHGPQVLVKHYAASRRSADRRAADHLGAVVHRQRPDVDTRASRTGNADEEEESERASESSSEGARVKPGRRHVEEEAGAHAPIS